MRTVLIPTDFNVNSLDLIGTVARKVDDKINIILFHAFDMPESLIDAMNRVGVNKHASMITEDLRMKCKRLKASNPNIANIWFRFMYGTTVFAFREFAAANDVNLLVLTPPPFIPVVKESVDWRNMLLRSGIEILDTAHATDNTLDDLTVEPQPLYS